MNAAIPRFFKRLLLFCVCASAGLYVADYAFLRVRMTTKFGGNAMGSVTTYSATATKSGKVEIFYERPQIEVCVKSLFPQLGHKPCWYLSRSPVNLITLRIGPEGVFDRAL